LGSGSDYSAFLQHAGIPTLNLGYGGENSGGEYHSIYDSYDHYSRFGDPGFAYGVTLAQTIGHAVLGLSEAETLPFEFKNLHRTISEYVADLMNLADQMRESTLVQNQVIKSGNYRLAKDPAKFFKAPEPEEEVPFIDFSPLQNALRSLELSSAKLSEALSKSSPEKGKAELNKRLYQAEQVLLNDQGLPRRDWYKHTLYAPGFYTGYGVKTIPGVREAIEQRNWKEAEEQIHLVAEAINRFSDHLAESTP
jgi:N-acetylated-alpha-linked acidic dipeptidase